LLPPLGCIEASGWRLVWLESLNPAIRAEEKDEERRPAPLDRAPAGEDGEITDVVQGSAASDAGLGPEMKPRTAAVGAESGAH